MKSHGRRNAISRAESPPSRGAWIEIHLSQSDEEDPASPPSRGAWIEIRTEVNQVRIKEVAPLAGGVD